MQKSLKKRKFIDVFRLLSPSSMLNIPNIMEKNLVMANILRLSLGRSGFGKSFTTPVQRPPPIQPFLLRKAVSAILFSSFVNKHPFNRAWKRGWSMDYCQCRLICNQIYHRSTSFYSRLPITRTLANSKQNRFPLDSFIHLPLVIRTLDNSNLPLTRSK